MDREAAENIRAQLDQGALFESLAKQNSLDPTASRGGDVGFVQKGSLVDVLDRAAFQLDVAEVSEIIEANEAYFIIKRIE
jgi:foldase protein PrsA